MAAPTISEYLSYANLQMAAEAFIRDEKTGQLRNSGVLYTNALTAGNLHASRFVESQAKKFTAEWEVLDQRANTKTGFSGTLFRNRDTNETVLSFRSTEFIDDAARDNKATNELEIKAIGTTPYDSLGQRIRKTDLRTFGVNPLSEVDASGLLAMRAQDIRPLEGDTTQYVAGSQETFAQLNGSEAFMSNVGKAAGAGADTTHAGAGDDRKCLGVACAIKKIAENRMDSAA